MKNKLYLIFSFIIIGFSLFIRLYKMENRAPFDWDQNRDYQAIQTIAQGKPTLIGPVAKGEGGFFLGPLYYYLATPAFILMNGSPSALPITSVLLDVLTVAAIIFFLRKVIGDRLSLLLAALWSFSWFTIEMSRISWNVALVPLWSVVLIYLLTKQPKFNLASSALLGLVVGLSWHIHAAVIPIGLALAVFFWKQWISNWKNIGSFFIGYLIPLIPLILFDVRHSGLNYHLLTQMFIAGTHVSVSYSTLIEAVMLRLGKNTQALLIGINDYNLIVGYLVFLTSLVGTFAGKGIYKLCSVIVVLNILALIALKETGFPEYYLALTYIPILIITLISFSKIVMNRAPIILIFVLFLVYLNIIHYSSDETSFSLSRKIGVANLLVEQGEPIDLRFELAPGREGGIKAFYKLYGGKLDKDSPIKIVVTDKTGGPINLDGELTKDIGYFGGIRVTKFVVQ